MVWLPLIALALTGVRAAEGGILARGKVQLICHRTANRDMPENTLESLALAARMGCNVVELDVRMTSDGELVLDHDGMLERLTDGIGDIERTSYDELELLDTGGFMSERFAGMKIAKFADALRVAREQGIGVDIDIKEKGEGPAIYAALKQEGMLERMIFGNDEGNGEDLRAIYPAGNHDATAWFGPLVTPAQVAEAHAQGKFVVANFSANAHEMDLAAMRAAVAAGVDALNVDYPRLGADAAGRPVEAKLTALAAEASMGATARRVAAIRELSYYTGFPTQALFARWLRDADDRVSRAAALALVTARPATPEVVFLEALGSKEMTARKNGAWALGMRHAAAVNALVPLLKEKDADELTEVLLALSRCTGDVPADAILPFFQHEVPMVRATAALALARHQPVVASKAVPALLKREEELSAEEYAKWVKRGKPKLTQAEIDPIIETYRLHMKLIHALEMLPPKDGLPLLAKEAFRSAEDSSHVTSVLAGYRLWDRIGADPALAMRGLDSTDVEVADRAEWMLVKGGPAVLPAVRGALAAATPQARRRLVRVLAWQGDAAALPLLERMQKSDDEDRESIDWAMRKIEALQFKQ